MLIRLAEESQAIRRFYPSEFGTDTEHSSDSLKEPEHQGKLAIRKYLRERTRQLEYTFLVAGPYADMMLRSFPPRPEIGSFDIPGKKAWLLGSTGDEKIAFTSRKDGGKLLVAPLLHPRESRNRALKVCSFVAWYNEALAEFERQTGGEAWEKHHVTTDDLERATQSSGEQQRFLEDTCRLRKLWIKGETLYLE
jgi:hypothetical protein